MQMIDRLIELSGQKIHCRKMPGEIEESEYLDGVLRDKFTNDFRTGYISVNGVFLPQYYQKFHDAIENFQVRDDDVWVCSFPKTGTTWTQEMVWCIANDLDFERAKVLLSERFPFLDHSILFDYTTLFSQNPDVDFPEYVVDSVSYVSKLPSPRFIKCHLPYDLLPRQIRDGTKKPKIVYVTRNAKDTCISYYNHCKLLEGYQGDFDDFCRLFIAGKLCYAPFWKHVLGFSSRRNDENILFLTYDAMKVDLASVIRKTADFLGKSVDGVYDSSNVEILMKHLSFESMKANPAVNYEEAVDINKKYNLVEADGVFMRSGEKDQWKQQMTREMIDTFDAWISQNNQDSGLASQ